MIEINKKFLPVAIMCILGICLSGCNNKKEAVIVSEELTTQSALAADLVDKSNNEKFDIKDLTMDNLKLFMTEEEVIKLLGEPVTKLDSSEVVDKKKDAALEDDKDEYFERVYSYNELSLIFIKLDNENHMVDSVNEEGTYKLTAVASLSEKNVFSRGLKVGNSIDDILDKYYRDQDYKSKYYKEDDGTIIGNYLYGDATIDNVGDDKIVKSSKYAVIDFTGYSSLKTADEYIITFTSFDDNEASDKVEIDDAFAQLTFDMNNDGNITAIRWYYYPED